MSQLVRSTPPRWSVMILVPGGGSAERAMQRVPIAARWLARGFEWFATPELKLRGCPGAGHLRADEVRIDRRRPPSEAPREGRRLPESETSPSSGATPRQNQFAEPAFRSVQTAFPWLARHFHRANVRQTAGLRTAQVLKEPELQASLGVTSAASEDIAWHSGAGR